MCHHVQLRGFWGLNSGLCASSQGNALSTESSFHSSQQFSQKLAWPMTEVTLLPPPGSLCLACVTSLLGCWLATALLCLHSSPGTGRLWKSSRGKKKKQERGLSSTHPNIKSLLLSSGDLSQHHLLTGQVTGFYLLDLDFGSRVLQGAILWKARHLF